MEKINVEKWICSMIEAYPAYKEEGRIPCMYKQALADQGLEYRNGEIVKKQSETKQELSEEYKKMLDSCIDAIRGSYYYTLDDKKEMEYWLESLHPQPKQTLWSEEDEQYFNFLEKLLVILQAKSTENEIKKGTNSNSEYYYKVIQWLKSLKDRVFPQPKQEWSEEDEDILNTIINHFEIDLECTKNDDIIRWLKSLKGRYTWKPSDEQMLAINTAINVLGKGTLNGKQLIELREELQKLREG